MRKIRLSDTDLELFDIEVSPFDYNFYQKHKDAFRNMWREQGTPFWTRFVITFRSFTVKHGVIKQMNIDSPKFQNLIDQAFIFIHEQFVDGNDKIAKNFIEDIAKLAQHQDKLPALDSKSFAKDPFYARDTRELFRQFFGKPDQRSSYLKVYILCPVFLRFGGSVCRCLVRWIDAPIQTDPSDDSYWIKPQDGEMDKSGGSFTDQNTMCDKCLDDSETRFYKEKINGDVIGPKYVEFWTLGDPRFNDSGNPLFGPHYNPKEDWREQLTNDRFRSFLQYAKLKYLPEDEQCIDCKVLRHQKEKVVHVCRKSKKKKKKSNKQEDLIKDLKEVRDKIDELESNDCISKEEKDRRVRDIIEKKPKVMEALQEVDSHGKKCSSEEDEDTSDSKANNSVFSSNATVTDDFQYGLLSRGEDDEACPPKMVAGFKVIKIEDEKNGLYEVNISSASIMTEEEDTDHTEKMKHKLKQRELNSFILTGSHLQEKIDGLPIQFEWWEGRGFCVAVFNYQDEEKEFTKKWTNFALKVSGFEEKAIKKIMLSMVSYVAKRKKRTCYGWTMEVDDVLACVLPQVSVDIADLSMSIQRGFRFEDRLTEEEQKSLINHQPNFCLDKVLMGLEEGEASSILTEKGGKDKLKTMFNAIAEYELYGSEFVCDIMKMLRNKQKNGNNKADTLWDKMVGDPDKFEFFCLVEKEKESDLWKTGMKTVDIRYFMNSKNPTVQICPICKVVGPACTCNRIKTITSATRQLIDVSKDDKDEVLNQDIPKMTYKEINSMHLDSETLNAGKENEKKSKSKKNKERKIELGGLPKKFQEVGIIAEKTLVSIPSKEDKLMGNVPINVDGKEDKMAPVPGLISSLNLILQNGGKEQTITVSMGAYMAESKIQHLQEQKNQLQLQAAEVKRMEEDLTAKFKKVEKKSKKEEKRRKKAGKVKQTNGKTNEAPETSEVQENETELNALFLKKILSEDEAKSVTRQINTQVGKSNKKPSSDKQSWSSKILEEEINIEDTQKKLNEIRETVKAVCINNKNKKGEPCIGDIKTGKTTYKKKLSDNTNNNNEESQFQRETIVYSSEPMDDDLTHHLSLLTEGIANCSILVVNNDCKLDHSHQLRAQEILEKKLMTRKLQRNGHISESKNAVAAAKSGSLKTCATCQKEEPSRKAFKKCQKCKDEGVENTRYYCSRECQTYDWKNKHKMEHRNNQLNS